MPRLFVAIPVPPAVASALAATLPPDLPALRRTAPDLMHLTLAFVGQLPEDSVPLVAHAVEAGVRATPPFHVVFDRLGSRFEDRGPIRMVWAGVGTGADELVRAGAAVRAALAQARIPFDPKPLRPHVTLARVRDGAAQADLAAVAAAVGATPFPRHLGVTADAVHVMESVLSRAGPRYSSRARIVLAGSH